MLKKMLRKLLAFILFVISFFTLGALDDGNVILQSANQSNIESSFNYRENRVSSSNHSLSIEPVFLFDKDLRISYSNDNNLLFKEINIGISNKYKSIGSAYSLGINEGLNLIIGYDFYYYNGSTKNNPIFPSKLGLNDEYTIVNKFYFAIAKDYMLTSFIFVRYTLGFCYADEPIYNLSIHDNKQFIIYPSIKFGMKV